MKQCLGEGQTSVRKPVIKLPESCAKLTLSELAFVQSIATCHMAFSVTLACPLRCAHCIVRASPERASAAMPVEMAAHYAGQMKELAALGISNISCTGGEPLLAARQVELLVNAAAESGIASGIVTSAHWATTPAAARRTIARFHAIEEWDISVDSFHQEFVPLAAIQNAYQAARDAGRRVTIRFTYRNPLPASDMRLLEFITTLEDASFTCQQVRAVGRGHDLGIGPISEGNPWTKPCLTQGMVVRYDGSIAPCCLNLVEERRHPFQFGDAAARPLAEIHRSFLASPLLQLLRTLGFSECLRWLDEAGLRSRLPDPLPNDTCELCSLIMGDPELSEFLAAKCSAPEMRLKIAVLASRILDEDQPLRALLGDLSNRATTIAGFPEAKAYLESRACPSPVEAHR